MARSKKEKPEGIRLLDLHIQNFKKMKFAHITVDDGGRIIYLTGKNKAGKSSVLEAIRSLTHGASETPEGPINDEAKPGEKSFVRGTYSNGFTVEERFTERGRYLTVLSADGGAYKQGTLDEWIDGISGDAIHLWTLKEDRMLNVLLKTTTEPDAPEKLNAFKEAEERVRKERTPFNSVIQVAQRMAAPDGERPKPADLIGLYGRASELERENTLYENLVKDHASAEKDVELAERNIADLQRKLVEWTAAREKAKAWLEQVGKEIESRTNPREERAQVQAEIRRVEAEEETIRKWKVFDEKQAEAQAAKVEAERLTADLEEILRQRTEYITGISSSVPGLTFTLPEGETKIRPILHGRGLYAASGAERARFQVDTLFALNPKLKIILIDEGAALDEDYLKQLAADAEERDFQIWICTIQQGIEGAIEIVDGRTVGDEG